MIERDEKEFLWNAQQNINTVLSKLFMGEIPQKIKTRAVELFQSNFRVQTDQKKGVLPMDKFKEKRQRYSRRKQLVVSCVHKALQENSIEWYSVKGIHLHPALAQRCFQI
jgi:hypothetical protein